MSFFFVLCVIFDSKNGPRCIKILDVLLGRVQFKLCWWRSMRCYMSHACKVDPICVRQLELSSIMVCKCPCFYFMCMSYHDLPLLCQDLYKCTIIGIYWTYVFVNTKLSKGIHIVKRKTYSLTLTFPHILCLVLFPSEGQLMEEVIHTFLCTE